LVRSSWRLFKLVALLLALAVDCLVRPPRNTVEGAEKIHRYCRRIVRALGIRWSVEGALPPDGAVVSNHLSYLDILLYGAVQPFVMVAKSEVRGWPLIGWLTARAGTVFVVRSGGPSTYPGVNRAMAEAYRSRLPVLFFPEGTTTDGSEVLPFRRGLFHSVLNEGVALRTAAVAYSIEDSAGGTTVADDVCWWGDALLAPHVFRLAGIEEVRATLRFGSEVTDRRDRFVLSEQARGRVQATYAELCIAQAPVVEAQEAELVEAVQDLLDRPVEGVCAFDGYRCVLGGGDDVEVRHWLCGGFELSADALFSAASLAHVAIDAAVQADLVGCVDVDAEVVELAQTRVVECEDAFDDEDGREVDGLGAVSDAGVGGEVVDRALDGAPVGEIPDVLDEKGVLERVGVVEVLEGSLVGRKMAEADVVEVQRQQSG
jgi:1-acyl-sn-glycerol-3-phosphate acyltransferase